MQKQLNNFNKEYKALLSPRQMRKLTMKILQLKDKQISKGNINLKFNSKMKTF